MKLGRTDQQTPVRRIGGVAYRDNLLCCYLRVPEFESQIRLFEFATLGYLWLSLWVSIEL